MAGPLDKRSRASISPIEMKRPAVRGIFEALRVLGIVFFILVSVFPLVWLFRAALSTPELLARDPLGIFNSDEFVWSNFVEAWTTMRVGQYFGNTVIVLLGDWFFTIVVVILTSYVIGVLRPGWARYLEGFILLTLFVPSVISMVPLYMMMVEFPVFEFSLLNNYLALWLPSAGNAFLILITSNYFRGINRSIFEAAKVDGASVVGMLFKIVLPMSGPVIGVISLLTLIASWGEYLWPMLVLPDTEIQTLAVALPRATAAVTESVSMAGLLIVALVPLIFFVIFQRQFLEGAGSLGSVKG